MKDLFFKYVEEYAHTRGLKDMTIAQCENASEMFFKLFTDNIQEILGGMEVSVDVSTGEDDAFHRYFGTITEVMECADESKYGVMLLVQDAEPNFDVK